LSIKGKIISETSRKLKKETHPAMLLKTQFPHEKEKETNPL
jgi:hypothetical protein